MGKKGVEAIVFNRKRWLNEKQVEEQLEHSNLPAITLQHSSKLRKQRQEIQNCGNYQPCRRFLNEDFAIQIIIDCRTMPAANFRSGLGFNQHDSIMHQEQSALSKIRAIFSAEEIILQHFVLGYYIDAYFPNFPIKLTVEIDEQRHKYRDIDQEIKRQKALEKELGCEFIRTNPAKTNFNVFIEIGRIQNYIVKSIKKLTEESTKKIKYIFKTRI